MNVLAFLPQYISEVEGLAIFVAVVVSGLPALITGRHSRVPDLAAKRVRLIVVLAVCGAAVIALLDFVTPGEPPGGLPQGHWGDSTDRLIMAVWLILCAALTVWNLVREARFRRSAPLPRPGTSKGYSAR